MLNIITQRWQYIYKWYVNIVIQVSISFRLSALCQNPIIKIATEATRILLVLLAEPAWLWGPVYSDTFLKAEKWAKSFFMATILAKKCGEKILHQKGMTIWVKLPWTYIFPKYCHFFCNFGKKWLKTSKSSMFRGFFQVPYLRWRVKNLVFPTAAQVIDPYK